MIGQTTKYTGMAKNGATCADKQDDKLCRHLVKSYVSLLVTVSMDVDHGHLKKIYFICYNYSDLTSKKVVLCSLGIIHGY